MRACGNCGAMVHREYDHGSSAGWTCEPARTELDALRAELREVRVRLAAAEACIEAAGSALAAALEVSVWCAMSEETGFKLDVFTTARAAWEATR